MSLTFQRLGFDPALVDYEEAFELQRHTHDEALEDPSRSTVFLLEHADVYTAGKRTEPHERPQDGTPVVDVDRGGKITWHGRGQLVGYPILRLKQRSLVKQYVCTLEDVIMKVLSEDYGIESLRIEDRTGVWIRHEGQPDRKIAAIGIRVHKGVTTHGFALNCSNSLDPFRTIIPCGISDADTTTISAELGRTVTPSDVVDRVAEELNRALPPLVLSNSEKDDDGGHGGTGPVLTDCSVTPAKEGVPA